MIEFIISICTSTRSSSSFPNNIGLIFKITVSDTSIILVWSFKLLFLIPLQREPPPPPQSSRPPIRPPSPQDVYEVEPDPEPRRPQVMLWSHHNLYPLLKIVLVWGLEFSYLTYILFVMFLWDCLFVTFCF